MTEVKIKVDLGEGVEITIPIKNSYSAAEFLGLTQSLVRGISAFHSKMEIVSKFGKPARRKNGKYDFQAIQKEIDKTALTYSEIERKFSMPDNSMYAYFKNKRLVRRVSNGKK